LTPLQGRSYYFTGGKKPLRQQVIEAGGSRKREEFKPTGGKRLLPAQLIEVPGSRKRGMVA
jgi:hypothetical protein